MYNINTNFSALIIEDFPTFVFDFERSPFRHIDTARKKSVVIEKELRLNYSDLQIKKTFLPENLCNRQPMYVIFVQIKDEEAVQMGKITNFEF